MPLVHVRWLSPHTCIRTGLWWEEGECAVWNACELSAERRKKKKKRKIFFNRHKIPPPQHPSFPCVWHWLQGRSWANYLWVLQKENLQFASSCESQGETGREGRGKTLIGKRKEKPLLSWKENVVKADLRSEEKKLLGGERGCARQDLGKRRLTIDNFPALIHFPHRVRGGITAGWAGWMPHTPAWSSVSPETSCPQQSLRSTPGQKSWWERERPCLSFSSTEAGRRRAHLSKGKSCHCFRDTSLVLAGRLI